MLCSPFDRRILAFVFILLLAIDAAAQRGAIVRPQNLAQITEQAADIVQGRVSSVRVEPHPQLKNLKTVFVSVAVTDTLKGSAKDSISFRQYLWDIRDIHESGGYRVGQELVLFLNRTSEIGLTSPVGIRQGRFRVEQDSQGTRIATNGENNAKLLEGVAQSSTVAKLSARSRSAIASGAASAGPLPVDVLKETVRAMVAAQRSNQ